MVSLRSKLTVLCFILSCMYYLSMGETLINFSYLILSYIVVGEPHCLFLPTKKLQLVGLPRDQVSSI